MSLAADVVEGLRAADASIATAESLTGGLLSAALIDIPGASDVVAGGVVAYSIDAKITVLDVPAALIAEHGTVDAEVAKAMATGARRRFGSTWAVSTTGVAGPGESEGHPAGTVFVAIAGPSGADSRELSLTGSRSAIRHGTVDAALSWMVGRLREESR